ncbi:MAG: hypothetical protein Q4C51_05455 [Clostridia bacterium]|nr:hypothetical protein [Clostridia bacterium]
MKEYDENKIYNSEELYKELNEERAREGKAEMPMVNPCPGGSTNSIAQKDKSWSSVPDFFVKMFKRKK